MASFTASHRIQGNLFAFFGMLIWAMTYPITDFLFETWNPLTLAMTRVLFAGILLGLITPSMGVKQLSWRDWPIKEGCLMGPIGLGLSTVLMNFAFQYSNAVNIAIISMMAPLVSIVMGMIRGEERMTFRSGVALCLAIVGGILVSVSNLDAEMGFRGGELLMVFSVILWTWFSRVSVTRLRLIPPFPRMALALTASGVALLPVVFLIQWSGITTLNPSWSISASWLPMCLILGVALSTGFWMMSVD